MEVSGVSDLLMIDSTLNDATFDTLGPDGHAYGDPDFRAPPGSMIGKNKP